MNPEVDSEVNSEKPTRTISSNWGIFIGLVIGAIIGCAFNIWGENPIREWLLKNLIQPVGTVFLRSLFMVIVPLVAGSLLVGVTNLGSTNLLKKLGWKVGLFYLTTTFCAIVVGQLLINVVQPGGGISESVREHALELASEGKISSLKAKSVLVGQSIWPGIIDRIIPKNILEDFSNTNTLAIIFVAILFGIALLGMGNSPPKEAFIGFFSALSSISVKIVGWIMKIAPYAVAALMIDAVTIFGIGMMKNIFAYVLVVFTGLLVQFFVIYGILLKKLVRISPMDFYKRALPIFLTAFSTSSSAATMPVTIRTLERRFGIPKSITTFSIPIGVTINMDGTALFEVMAVIFVAQVFGVDLSFIQHITLVALVLVTSVGVAGVPGASLPILIAVMSSLGIPAEGIALILGVDRLLDMARTVTNVTGDSVATLFLARSENQLHLPPLTEHSSRSS